MNPFTPKSDAELLKAARCEFRGTGEDAMVLPLTNHFDEPPKFVVFGNAHMLVPCFTLKDACKVAKQMNSSTVDVYDGDECVLTINKKVRS